MINSKQELREYMRQDKKQLGITRRFPRLFADEVWKFEIILRKYEYYLNSTNFISKCLKTYYKFKYHVISIKLGIQIPPNTCDKGLSIAHINCININVNSKIGKNLRIHEGVTIGASGGVEAPVIGDNVFLGSGCKIMGKIKIADNCVVGTNAVVVKDVLEEGITVAGVPAKKISNNDSVRFIFTRLKR